MIFELKVMIAIALLYWFLGHVAIPTKTRIAGLAWNLGNRDQKPEFPAWVHRAERAQANLLESLPLYFSLAIACQAVGVSNLWTHLGAWIFLGGRLLHAACYLAGVVGLRSLGYGIATGGLLVMASQLG